MRYVLVQSGHLVYIARSLRAVLMSSAYQPFNTACEIFELDMGRQTGRRI